MWEVLFCGSVWETCVREFFGCEVCVFSFCGLMERVYWHRASTSQGIINILYIRFAMTLLFILEFRNLYLILRYLLFSQELFPFSKLNGFNVNNQQIKRGQRTETLNFLVVQYPSSLAEDNWWPCVGFGIYGFGFWLCTGSQFNLAVISKRFLTINKADTAVVGSSFHDRDCVTTSLPVTTCLDQRSRGAWLCFIS